MDRRRIAGVVAFALSLLFVASVRAFQVAPADPKPAAATPAKLKVGVTLHPYYSWTANVVAGTDVEVRPIVPGEIDAGNYQPRAEDIRKLADLDAIVVNGVGHDDFIFDMVKASGNAKVVVIRPNDEVPLLRAKNGGAVNSHTFLSFTNAIQQTYAIAKALTKLRPEHAEKFDANAADYAKRLRRIKAKAAVALADAAVHKVVTVHDGYGYLMQEFGIDIDAVVEPSHGLVPSGAELKEVIDILKRDQIGVVFSEESFPKPLLEVVREQGHARVYLISHIASGEYTADKFEKEMQGNVDAMVRALVTDPAAAPAEPKKEARAEESIPAQLEAFRAAAQVPALGAALVTVDGAVGAWVTGVRANGHPEKVEPDDVWHLGSCTKSMTATLIALLVESGRLDWQTPLAKLLPECAATMDAQYQGVTLELLLKHRAGVPNDLGRDGLWASFRDASRHETPTQQRARMAKTVLAWPPVHAPATAFLYSNVGVSIAGHVAEVATGKPYEELMRELLFEPLGMKSAGFGAPGHVSADGPRRESGGSFIDTPRGHQADGTVVEPGDSADNPPAIGPGGRAYASLADWAKFVALTLKGAKGDVKVGAITIHRATFAKLQAPFDGPGEKYAAGWAVCERPWAGGDGKTLTHTGSNTLWYCVAWLGLDAGIAVLATTNEFTPAAQKAADQACALLLQEQAKRAIR